MKGYAHKIITASAAMLLGAPAIGVAGATLGSTLPDIDIKLGIPHRTWTHYWPVYASGMAFVWYFEHTRHMTPLQHAGMVALWWFFAGALFHILEDSFTKMGVPWIVPSNPKKRFSFGITTTGGFFEKFVVVAAVVAVFMKFPPATWSTGVLNMLKYNTPSMGAVGNEFWHFLNSINHLF